MNMENKKELREQLIREAKEINEKFRTASKETERLLHFLKTGELTVIDWNEKEKALESGIVFEDRTYGDCRIKVSTPEKILRNVVFRNFGELFVENARISRCVFENCRKLNISDCRIDDCIFNKTGFISADNTDFSDSYFHDSSCQADPLISIENGNFPRCWFENIELRKGAYLIEAYGDVWVDYCDFSNVHTENKEGKIFHCEETRGKIFKKTVEFQIVDEESCTGLDDIEIIE